jgi:hypothetical protein
MRRFARDGRAAETTTGCGHPEAGLAELAQRADVDAQGTLGALGVDGRWLLLRRDADDDLIQNPTLERLVKQRAPSIDWEPLQRVDPTTPRAAKGTGVWISHYRHLIRRFPEPSAETNFRHRWSP